MKKKSRITIAHLHVWDKNNKGDFAIVIAVQELLRSNFSGCHVVDYPVSLLRDGTMSDATKINKADIVIIGGGGIFYSYFLPYNERFIEAIKKPIFIFGAGYIREVDAPELSSEAAHSVAFLASKATGVGIRDNNTKKFLIKQGVKSKKIAVIGDPAALLSEKRPSATNLKKLNLINIPKSLVSLKSLKLGLLSGLSSSSQVPSKQELLDVKIINPIRIGLNLNYSGWLGFGKWHNDILQAYRDTAVYFQKTYGGSDGSGVEIYYLKHHPGEDKIYPELKIQNLHVVDLPPSEQKYVYGQLDLVIGMMLHVGVMAFGAGTAEISVAYDLRNYSFAEFISLPELVVDLEKLKKGVLLTRAQQVFKKRKKYAAIFKSKKNLINKKQANFLEIIKKNNIPLY